MQAKYILIATGGKAVKLPIEGAEHAIISDEILNLPSLPKKLAVIGGGYIGLEFAGIYNNYGSEVHVVYRQVSIYYCLVLFTVLLLLPCFLWMPVLVIAPKHLWPQDLF